MAGGVFLFSQMQERLEAWRVVSTGIQGVVRNLSDHLSKGRGFACPRCKAPMSEVVRIAPVADEPGLIAYE
jgi:hypothetical protein